MLEVGIAQLVMGNSGVEAIIGTRFYPVLLPDNPTYPCASYQLISDIPDYLLDCTQGMNCKRLQVDTWSGGTSAASYLDAKNAGAAIRAVLELWSGVLSDGTHVNSIQVANSVDGYEQDARVYRNTADYLIFFT